MRVTITNEEVEISLDLTEGIWACKRCVRVPTDDVSVVRRGIPEARLLDIRVLGTFIPGVIKAGTYYTKNGKEFWYVPRGKRHYVTVELSEDRPFRRIVLGLDDVAPLVERFGIREREATVANAAVPAGKTAS